MSDSAALESPRSLAFYAIDPVTGFVPSVPPLRALPAALAPWDALVPEVGALIRSRRIRETITSLPTLSIAGLQTDAERERALMLLAHFANAYVWGGDTPLFHLPPALAVPLCALAAVMDRPPIAHYASMTLSNWQLVDPARPLSVDNARTLVQFLGGVDEDWFFIASMGVELAGTPSLLHAIAADAASRSGSDAELTASLGQFTAHMSQMHTALERVREWCDPRTYYLRVRPFVTGWPAPGVVYEGVSTEPRKYFGGSASQSSLLQAFDAMLGLTHPDSPTGGYLRTVRSYMPLPHRTFVTDIERESQVRARASAGSAALRSAYNDAVDAIGIFRTAHMSLAHDFIVAPSGNASDAKGTGGTALHAFLKGAQDATAAAKL